MNYIDQIFTRADIQQIRAFLMHGTEGVTDLRSFKQRLDGAEQVISVRLRRDYPNETDFEEIIRDIYAYGDVLGDVYMEIGMQIGAILAAQAACNVKTAFEKKAKL